jgi:integrase
MRLDDYVVERLAPKRKQYTVWDLAVQGCGARISAGTKSCVISVWTGGRLKFETIGRVSPDSPYEYLREQTVKRIGELKRERLPPVSSASDPETLREAVTSYIGAHPELGPRTVDDYNKWLQRGFGPQMDQPIARLVTAEILRLNVEHLKSLAEMDPDHQPPKGFWAWQGKLRVLRTIVGWHAAQKERPSPWPDPRALRIRTAPPRELAIELQTVEGRRRLIEGLKAIDSKTARADRLLCYTGFRRREGTSLKRVHLVADGVVEFKSKTRTLRVPLSRQALALLDPKSADKLLHVGDSQLRKPLIRIFGERETARGKRPRVTPHDLRRLFKSVGAEIGIDPVILNLLAGHTVKGVDKHYLAKLRIGVLRTAAQRIADEIDNPSELTDGECAVAVSESRSQDIQLESVESYLPRMKELAPRRHAHYLKREDLHKLVWTAPVSEIAARIGISNVGLAKTCRRAAIPLPGRGYWAKVSADREVETGLLPPAPPGVSEFIRVTGLRRPPTARD